MFCVNRVDAGAAIWRANAAIFQRFADVTKQIFWCPQTDPHKSVLCVGLAFDGK